MKLPTGWVREWGGRYLRFTRRGNWPVECVEQFANHNWCAERYTLSKGGWHQVGGRRYLTARAAFLALGYNVTTGERSKG